MQALSLLRYCSANRAVARLPTPFHTHRNSSPTIYRLFSTNDNFKQSGRSTPVLNERQHQNTNEMFKEENVKDLSSEEIARLRLVYRLVKEHIAATEGKTNPADLDSNPLLDPRSFDIKNIPSLSPELLELFRKDVPSDIAAVSRPLSTHGIWDGVQGSERQAALNAEFQATQAAEMNASAEGITDFKSTGRVQQRTDLPYKSDPAWVGTQRKQKCPLKDERGRVNVDFRAVAALAPYVSENGKILPRRRSSLSAKAQRRVARAVKTARQMALLHPEPNPAPTYEELLELERSLP